MARQLLYVEEEAIYITTPDRPPRAGSSTARPVTPFFMPTLIADARSFLIMLPPLPLARARMRRRRHHKQI